MQRKKNRFVLAVLVLALAIIVSSCSPAPTAQVATAAPTRTPRPTFTPTVVVTPTRLIVPTATPAATTAPAATDAPAATAPAAAAAPTATAQPGAQLSAAQAVNVRQGPGTGYPVLGQLNAGDNYKVTAVNSDGSWLQISYNGDPAWVIKNLVGVTGDLGSVPVAQNIAPPPTAVPVPVQVVPTAVPQPTAVPAPPKPAYRWTLVPGSAQGAPNCGTVYFSGKVVHRDGSPENGVYVHIAFYGPRTTKYSGGGGAGDGNWGFTPFGTQSGKGTTVEIYVIAKPSKDVPGAGLTYNAGEPQPAPLSDKFVVTVGDRCQLGQWTNITFQDNEQ